jgi:hypothetical protein
MDPRQKPKKKNPVADCLAHDQMNLGSHSIRAIAFRPSMIASEGFAVQDGDYIRLGSL